MPTKVNDTGPQQNEKSILQSPSSRIPERKFSGSSSNAPEVVPLEDPWDRLQSLQPGFGTEQSQGIIRHNHVSATTLQVVPIEHQDAREPGLHIFMGKEEKEMTPVPEKETAPILDTTSGLEIDPRDKAEAQAIARRRRLRHIIGLTIIAAIIVVVTVVLPTMLTRQHGSSSATR